MAVIQAEAHVSRRSAVAGHLRHHEDPQAPPNPALASAILVPVRRAGGRSAAAAAGQARWRPTRSSASWRRRWRTRWARTPSGRDSLSRILAGAKTSLFVGFVAATAAVTIGVFLGLSQASWARAVDGLIMMVVDIFLAFPGLLLTIAMVAVFGAGLWQVILAITISDIPRTIRLQRSLVLSLKSRPYIDAARMAHASTPWLLIQPRHPAHASRRCSSSAASTSRTPS